jgi:hypothetical protein
VTGRDYEPGRFAANSLVFGNRQLEDRGAVRVVAFADVRGSPLGYESSTTLRSSFSFASRNLDSFAARCSALRPHGPSLFPCGGPRYDQPLPARHGAVV